MISFAAFADEFEKIAWPAEYGGFKVRLPLSKPIEKEKEASKVLAGLKKASKIKYTTPGELC